ncbi:MAG TPA: Xaa-Pro peptidase family protein, partial [Gemmatimonadales bacterium]|nr:Xaa-Pro peptidase family protein [Gemmatimonadales bacterium]
PARFLASLGITAAYGAGVIPVAGSAQAGAPAGPVPVDRLAARRAALFEQLGTGVAVIPSGKVRSIERDYPQDSDYREANDFFYLTGLESPGSWLVLLARDSAPDEAVLLVPPPDATVARWTGRSGTADAEIAGLSGIGDIRRPQVAEEEIRSLVLGGGSPARAGSLYIRREAEAADSPFFRHLVSSAGAVAPPVPVADIGAPLAALRQIKDAEELRRLRRAVAITGEALREAMTAARPGMHEYELEARIEYVFRRGGAERVGFPSIVGSGPNGTALHYDRNRRQIRHGDLVVMDVGAEYGYLTADVTRTIPITGKFSDRQRALYELVRGAADAALARVAPGVTLPELDRVARSHLRERSGSLCGAATCDGFFVHGLSHWLGMGVHDVGPYGAPLAPGMVFTVEPGIYLPEEGVGIRIEDDVLVTASGYELLTAGIPRTAEEVERAMSRR